MELNDEWNKVERVKQMDERGGEKERKIKKEKERERKRGGE